MTTRINPWSTLAVALALTILAVVGCGTRPSKNAAQGPASTAAAPDQGESNPLFQDWPTPAGALVITGEQLGYLAPCGCTQGQKGGLIRREILINKLGKQGWPLALIDLGSLINDPATHGGPVETKVRYTVALQALAQLNYDAVALSAQDMKLEVQEVLGQYMNLGDRPKIVSANVTTPLGLEDKLVPSVRTAAGPIKIGVTAVLDPETLKAINDPNKADLLTVKTPDEVLPAVLADLEKDTHVQVLMVQGPPELAKDLAERYPGFGIVVGTSTYVDAPKDPEPLNGGKTLLIQVGKKGQYVGVVGLFQDPREKIRYQRIELHDRYTNTPELAGLGEPMRQLLDEQFPNTLKAAGALENYPRRRYVAFDAPADAHYVGALTCKECHPGTYDQWSNTPHARAYRGLTKKARNREWDAECVSCHVTGFEYETGYTTPDATPHLKGNQCENCHGPGSKHAADPDNTQYLKAIARSADDFQRNYRCLVCHDEDNDPHFNWDKYWPKIEHNELDSYDDPKVHQGITSKGSGQ